MNIVSPWTATAKDSAPAAVLERDLEARKKRTGNDDARRYLVEAG